MEIKANTFVRHVLGGPTMWVTDVHGIDTPMCVCVWFDKNDILQRGRFLQGEVEETTKPLAIIPIPFVSSAFTTVPNLPSGGTPFNPTFPTFPTFPTLPTAPLTAPLTAPHRPTITCVEQQNNPNGSRSLCQADGTSETDEYTGH